MTVDYEWDFESLNEYGDIIDHSHHDGLKGVECGVVDDENPLCLVKDNVSWNHDGSFGGCEDRAWAYVKNKELPKEFTDGTKVPQKYIKEFEKWKTQ